ncbi:MAG: C4-dicarboxylate ABC transporter substrate-binding protein [Rhodospirillaceae bacterium]|jgi:uncharacterized protein|nr:C4-dicarboxylate ABC transporter substrate-binding protein [Rhodospirillaceae bacterium]MBT7267882.1 C4-dicarboxylate ABC transporter substrate-binding protein [Rhodospirillaceae bacterium]
MKKFLMAGAAVLFTVGAAQSVQAQNVTLTSAAAQPGGGSDVSAKYLAEVAAANKIATIQVQVGQVLTKTMVQVAQGKTDITASAFILNFLMSRGLGPYSGLGKEKGKVLAGNLRILYPFHLAHFVLVAFQTTGIDSYAKLKGKIVHNGPPRGGALVTARSVIRLSSGGLAEGKGYTGKQIAWGQANNIFLDRTVDAAVRPATNPASWMPIIMSAGKVNMVSVPKKLFEGKAWTKYSRAPGNVPVLFPVSELAHYGPNVRVISDDNMFRSVANAGGAAVNKNMDKKLAKALTAAFIKNIPDLYKKTAFAKTSQFGNVDDKNFNFCKAGIKFHPGAVEAWEEAGHKIIACAKP